ncbi:MAG: hypothetical protein QOH06_4066 [Acidobacteriota bacterium]|nr:hypothetical protein [Acidobacteriota bacterium]
MLRIEARQVRLAPNMLRKTAGMLRLAHERLPLTVGPLRLGAESEHTERERSRRTAESEHLCLAWPPPGLRMLPISRDQGAITRYFQQPSRRPSLQPSCQSQRARPSRLRSIIGVFTSNLAQRRAPGSQPRRGMPRVRYFL